jgi:hypothetical protein
MEIMDLIRHDKFADHMALKRKSAVLAAPLAADTLV